MHQLKLTKLKTGKIKLQCYSVGRHLQHCTGEEWDPSGGPAGERPSGGVRELEMVRPRAPMASAVRVDTPF